MKHILLPILFVILMIFSAVAMEKWDRKEVKECIAWAKEDSSRTVAFEIWQYEQCESWGLPLPIRYWK